MPDTARIAYLTDVHDVGGGEVNILELAGRLDPARFTPVMTAIRPGLFQQACERRGLPVELLPAPPPRRLLGLLPWLSPGALLETVSLLRRVSARLVHANSFTTALYGGLAARRLGLPVLWTCRGWAFRSHGLQGRFLRSFVHRIVAISEWTRAKVLAPGVVPPARVEVVLQGVDLVRFTPRDADPELREELGLGGDTPTIGIVGTLYPLKGHARLFRALAALKQRGVPARVLVVGEGSPPDSEDERRIRSLPGELGVADRVVFAGRRTDLASLYALMDVLAAPSDVESFGTAIVEAQASGVPVVCTEVGGPAETVRDGETGWLLPPDDGDAWVDRLAALITDPELRTQIGTAGRAHAEERFDQDRVTARYQEIYQELIG